MQFLTLLVWLSNALVGISATALPSIRPPRNNAVPLPPSIDPWYTAPPNFEKKAAGTVLRVRTAPGNLTTVIGNASAAYNIMFRTTNSHYEPSWAVTTVFVPKTAFVSTTGGKALLSYQIAYNSPDVDFSPSYGLYYALTIGAFGIPSDASTVSSAVGRGWFVNVPDFEGPEAAYGAAVLAGHAVIDSVRAILSLANDYGINPNNVKYALWGYSGGAFASQMAAELQVQYAHELGFAGAALGGLTPNMSSGFQAINASPYVGNLVLLLLGIMNEYPAADTYLTSRLKPSGPQNATAFLAGRNMGPLQAFAAYGFQDIYGYFIGGEADLRAPVIQKIFNNELYMGYHGVPQMPVFAYKAIADEFSPIGATDALLARYCGIGASILYERNTVGGHIGEIANGEGRALEWLAAVFNGSYVAQGCTTRNVTVQVVDVDI